MSIFMNPASGSKEQASAYVAAIVGLVGDKEPLEVLHATAAAAAVRLGGLSLESLSRPEAPGKWSMLQVLQHLTDSELVWGWRLRMVLAHDRPLICGYDQDLWADRLGYDQADPRLSLSEFTVMRDANLRLLVRTSPEDRKRVGIHAERGEETVEHMMRLNAGHDLLHLNQLDRIRRSIT